MRAFDTNAGDVSGVGKQANGVNGNVVSVRTNLDNRVDAWQAVLAVTTNDQRFFCHGYSFGTSYVQFGAGHDYSLFGDSVPRVLADEYNLLGKVDKALLVQPNDVLVWWSGKTKEPYHSALVDTPVFLPSGVLDKGNTLVNSKTGTSALRLRVPLTAVETEDYPGQFYIEVYRRA